MLARIIARTTRAAAPVYARASLPASACRLSPRTVATSRRCLASAAAAPAYVTLDESARSLADIVSTSPKVVAYFTARCVAELMYGGCAMAVIHLSGVHERAAVARRAGC